MNLYRGICVLIGSIYLGTSMAGHTAEEVFVNADRKIMEIKAEEMCMLGEGCTDLAGYALDYGISVLPDERNAAIYAYLKSEISTLAEDGGLAVFEIPAEVLGDIFVDASVPEEIGTAMRDAFDTAVYPQMILECLLADCPYELYWFDKTVGINWSYSLAGGNGNYKLGNVKFWFAVAQGYQAEQYDAFNPAVTTAVGDGAHKVKKAKANVDAVVQANVGKSDLEKLMAYKTYICESVTYDEAAASTPNYPYGDAWQLIPVFDGDENTNVVCEGYAKAFQYLCELSDFEDENFACYVMNGRMSGGTGAGAHMWNVVRLGGCNYLVDVANSDEGTIGQSGELFMASVPDEGDENGYRFVTNGGAVVFAYDENTKKMYREEIRKLGGKGSVEVHAHGNGRMKMGFDRNCTENGQKTYYVCECGEWFWDAACSEKIENHEEVKILAGHVLKYVDEKTADCCNVGNRGYWHCGVCAKDFSDEEGSREITGETVIAATGQHSSELWKYDERSHYKMCDVGQVKFDEGEHQGGDASTTDRARCEVCGAEYGEVLEDNSEKADEDGGEAEDVIEPEGEEGGRENEEAEDRTEPEGTGGESENEEAEDVTEPEGAEGGNENGDTESVQEQKLEETKRENTELPAIPLTGDQVSVVMWIANMIISAVFLCTWKFRKTT